MRLSEDTAAYLDKKKHQNAAQTLVEKGRTYKDFTALFGDLEINLISKAEIVQWKTNDLKRMGANRLNKRLGQVNDFFSWAINHGHYTAHSTSPVEGLFIKGAGKLSAKTEHYEPFSNDDLKAIFSSAYPVDMGKPDNYCLPVVALFSGARHEEIASLKAANVKTVEGVSCFQIEGGKTADARRLVPVHPQLQALRRTGQKHGAGIPVPPHGGRRKRQGQERRQTVHHLDGKAQHQRRQESVSLVQAHRDHMATRHGCKYRARHADHGAPRRSGGRPFTLERTPTTWAYKPLPTPWRNCPTPWTTKP